MQNPIIPVRKGARSISMNTSSPIFDAELHELLKSIQNGNSGRFEALLNRYDRLICTMTNRFGTSISAADADDLRQEAILALYRAAMRFDLAQKEVQFGLFAKTCIRHALISHLRKQKKQEAVVLLEDDLLEAQPEQSERDPGARLIEEESYLAISERIRISLSEQENRIWWLYLSGRTAGEISYPELVHRGKAYLDDNLVWVLAAVATLVVVHVVVSKVVMKGKPT